MKIVKGASLEISELTEAVPILFYFEGTYSYVCSGIAENELRVMKNWQISERSCYEPWLILWSQGCRIPQELGDYLVTHQDNDKTANETEQTED